MAWGLNNYSDSAVQAYFKIYDYEPVKNNITNFLCRISELLDVDGETLAHQLDYLTDEVSRELQSSASGMGRLITQIYRPFLENLKKVLDEHKLKAYQNFICELEPRFDEASLFEKRYPLHLVDKTICITIPFANTGPGTAVEVQLEVAETVGIRIESPKIHLGNITPGRFVVPISLTITEPITEITLYMIVDWRCAGLPDEKIRDVSLKIGCQSPDIDWETLEYLHPYSLDIARGEEFIGREDTLRRMSARLSTAHMRSFYITGQKRVGKSSLARALIDYFHQKDHTDTYEFIFLEVGEFAYSTASETLAALGRAIVSNVSHFLPVGTEYESMIFTGSLAPLGQLFEKLEKHIPTKRFVLIIDEFDEINHELYRYGSLAETFFLNLRTFSAKPNVAFIFIGGERLTFVMAAQGEKLNRFERESLDSFDQETEWKDYELLIRKPSGLQIRWHDSAIRAIYNETRGHPYYTKLICSWVFENIVKSRDAEITQDEIISCLPSLIGQLDTNSFAHFWKDGIQGNYEDIEIISLKRCHVLTAYARVKRRGEQCDLDSISKYISGRNINKSDVPVLLQEFCARRIMEEHSREYKIIFSLFERWLIDVGINLLIADQFGEELSDARAKDEENAYVKSTEITDLVSKWPLYQGRAITPEHVRSWLSQVKSPLDQRLLFTLLIHLKFVSDLEIREHLKTAHRRIHQQLPIPIKTKKIDRRKDILVTYADGAGKSGSHISNLYASENNISTKCVVEMNEINGRLELDSDNIKAIIITDDFAGTGNSLASNLEDFCNRNSILEKLNIPVFIVVVYATVEGEEYLRQHIMELGYNDFDLHVCNLIAKEHSAFADGVGFWESNDAREKAKALCLKFGVKISKNSPLGFGEQGLLLCFPMNCPNNSLPILHSGNKGESPWVPLLPRRKV